MQYFDHVNARTLREAADYLRSSKGSAKAMAGGTDLLGVLKDRILPQYPETVVNLKTIEGLEYIKQDHQGLKIGALTKLTAIAESDLIREKCPSLARAADSVATPLIRNLATIGGNLCQDVRCWYYRYPDDVGGAMQCLRKGGDLCYAVRGENRYNSIFGGMKVSESPCTARCPNGTDIPGYISRLRAGDMVGAARIIMRVNPMPAITARVCGYFCQEGCSRNACDENVSISALERFVGDYILDHVDEFFTAPEQESGKRVAIVGSGPGGLTAAYYLRQAGHAVTVYEKMAEAGGLLTYAIPAYRLPKECVGRTMAAFEKIGITFRLKTEIGKDIRTEDLDEQYDSIFFDTGAWKRRIIGIEGEEMTTFGLEFLMEVKQWMKDKPGRNVLVIGGGNVAVDVAVTAKRLGAVSVTMVCLEAEKELPASIDELRRAREEGVVILPQWSPTRVLRDDDRIKGLDLVRCESVFDLDGKFAPVFDDTVKKSVSGDSILVAVGQRTDLSFLGKDIDLETKNGLIAVDPESQMTSKPGLFAGGEVTSGPATVVMALKSGRKAAAAMNEYLGVKAAHVSSEVNGFLAFDPQGVLKSARARLPERLPADRSVEAEDTSGLEYDEAMTEAERCLNCGCIAVNPSDIATVLLALDATIKTTKRTLTAEEFFTSSAVVTNLLDDDELVTEIMVSGLGKGHRSVYEKFRVRSTIDFAIVSVAFAYEVGNDKIKNARIALGGVAPVAFRAREVEDYLNGRTVSEDVAAEAAELAVKGAIPLEKNGYKIPVLKTMVKRAVLKR
ncbi:pyridine nucleotide-disulfide oxidoreductase [delta proteobacterium NaphS2]|nr:pyridine nucleotide-disulfide oxidoreductase [delta proteobacterium NaphS2]